MTTGRPGLAHHRRMRGYTQQELAERLGVELSTVGRWERGLVTPQPWMWPKLARQLHVSAAELGLLLRVQEDHPNAEPAASRGDGDGDVRLGTEPSGVETLRRLVGVYDLPEDGPVRSLPALERDVTQGVWDRLNSQYTKLLAVLPRLLPELTRALFLSEEADRARLAALLAQAYRAADAVADKNGHWDLSARCIQIMRWAAHQSEDPGTLAAAAYVRAETFFADGQLAAGRRMVENAAAEITHSATAEQRAGYGALHMRAAAIAARAGLAERARAHLGEARAAADSVDEDVYAGTAFGPDSVRVHEVTVALDLDDPGSALATAAGWAPSPRLPAERRSHLYVDIARAQASVGRPEAALDAVTTAHTLAPEHIRIHPHVHALVSDLIRDGTAAPAFAQQLGIPSTR